MQARRAEVKEAEQEVNIHFTADDLAAEENLQLRFY